MSKRLFVSCALVALLLMSSLSMVSAATGTVQGERQTAVQPQAGINVVCRYVTAQDMRVFSGPNSSTVIGRLFRGAIFYADGISNNRYHIYYPMDGWVSADPQWTNPC